MPPPTSINCSYANFKKINKIVLTSFLYTMWHVAARYSSAQPSVTFGLWRLFYVIYTKLSRFLHQQDYKVTHKTLVPSLILILIYFILLSKKIDNFTPSYRRRLSKIEDWDGSHVHQNFYSIQTKDSKSMQEKLS